MKIQDRMNGLSWRLRTGAFGFYSDGLARATGALLRVTTPRASVCPSGRAGRLGLLAFVLAPAILFGSEFARDARYGALLPDARQGRGEVGSLRASLDRYYGNRESTRALFSGRELALPVVVSGYTSRICETDSTPFVTAANTPTRPGVIALSRDLLRRYTPGAPFEFGDVVHLSGIGDFIVEDVMNGRWERHADIWFEHLDDARQFGRRRVVLTGPYGADEYKASRPLAQVASARGGAAP
jgi:3D (Asp-Asp-Asp) domain-containing protein